LEATVWLERFLCSREGTLIVTAHDIAFLDAIAEESVAIKFKKLEYFEGTPSAWEVQRLKNARKFKGQKDALDKKREHVCSPHMGVRPIS
jgi:ATP-binding cassette, subfamily F, member 3